MRLILLSPFSKKYEPCFIHSDLPAWFIWWGEYHIRDDIQVFPSCISSKIINFIFLCCRRLSCTTWIFSEKKKKQPRARLTHIFHFLEPFPPPKKNWLKIFENNWEYFPKIFLQKTSGFGGDIYVYSSVSRVIFLPSKRKKINKNVPTDRAYLEGPSARKTGVSFLWPNWQSTTRSSKECFD